MILIPSDGLMYSFTGIVTGFPAKSVAFNDSVTYFVIAVLPLTPRSVTSWHFDGSIFAKCRLDITVLSIHAYLKVGRGLIFESHLREIVDILSGYPFHRRR